MTLFAALLVAGCSSSEGDEGDTASGASAAADTDAPAQGQSGGLSIQQQFDLSMTFTSPVFNMTDPERKERRIPKAHTCTKLSMNEPNISPPLEWSGAPEGTQGFALIMHSTEPVGSDEPWIHWVTWNIPADVTELAKGVLSNGALQGLNGSGTIGYLGPCPPDMISKSESIDSNAHKDTNELEIYYFEIYALDTKLDLAAGATIDELLQAIDGHVLAGGKLVGERQGKLIRKEDT
jgi:Raf kinase inhibitor-like YbhB/YbcL family protein